MSKPKLKTKYDEIMERLRKEGKVTVMGEIILPELKSHPHRTKESIEEENLVIGPC